MDIPLSGILGIQGPSGRGKSTLLKLLMRYWDPQQGTVSMSGHALPAIDAHTRRRLQTMMSQETYLFDDTIAGNLRIAKPEASDDELHRALEQASIAALVDDLPEGMETRVGEEDLKQFHVGGDQRDHIAVATVRKRSRSESAQCVERTFTEQCEQTERQIVVHVLLAVGHDAADRRTHHHQGHGPADRQTPHRVTKRRARRHDAKHRHERGRQVAEHTKAACQHHQRTQ